MDKNYKTEDLSKYLTKQPKRKTVAKSSSSKPSFNKAQDWSNPGYSN